MANDGRLEVNGRLDLHAAGLTLVGGPLVNNNSIFADGQLNANLVNKNNLVVGLGGSQAFTLIGTRHENHGGISVTSGGFLEVKGPLIQEDATGRGALYLAGSLRMSDAPTLRNSSVELQAGGAIEGRADITQTGGSFLVSQGGAVNAHSFTILSGGVTIDGSLDTWPAGDAKAIVSLLGGELHGNGVINGDLFVGGGPGAAIFKPGHSPGHFTLNGGFTLLPWGELELEVEGANAGTGGALAFDVVSSRHTVLDGLVRIKLGADLGNTSMQSLQFLECASGCEFGSHFGWLVEGGDDTLVPSSTFNGLQLTIPPAAPVPEPAGWLLWLAGIAGCRCLRHRMTVSSSTSARSSA